MTAQGRRVANGGFGPHDAPEHVPARLRRSVLVAPGDNAVLIGKLSRSQADVAVLELEDGVHPDRKLEARRIVAESLSSCNWGRKDTVVRVNSVLGAQGRADIEHLVPLRPTALMLPKVQTVNEVHFASMLMADAEQRAGLPAGSVRIWVQVETARGVLEVDRLAFSDPRLDGILLGCGDLSADLGVKRIGIGAFRRPAEDPHELLFARGRVVAAARAAGVDCFDTASIHLRDLAMLRRRAEYSAQMGFSGVIVVSPRHVPIINEVFSPSDEDVAWAEQIVLLARRNGQQPPHRPVIFEDEPVTTPVLGNALQILDRREQVRALESGFGAAPAAG